MSYSLYLTVRLKKGRGERVERRRKSTSELKWRWAISGTREAMMRCSQF